MTHVWNNSKQGGSRLLMLLAIADYANEQGKAWPSLETLAQRTRQTTRNTIRIIEKCVADKELEYQQYASPYGTNLYSLKISRTEKVNPKASRRTSDILGINGNQTDTSLSPDPSLSDQKPSRIKEGAATPPAVIAYREIARRFPDKATWEDISRAVGEADADLAFWREVIHGYIACGWNKTNIKSMLEFYARREIPSVQRNGNGARPIAGDGKPAWIRGLVRAVAEAAEAEENGDAQ